MRNGRGARSSYYATDAQVSYLKRLLIEAFSHRYPTVYDYHHLSGVTREQASTEIDRLKSAKNRGWPKGESLPRYSAPGPWDHLSDETRARYAQYRKAEPMAHVRAYHAPFGECRMTPFYIMGWNDRVRKHAEDYGKVYLANDGTYFANAVEARAWYPAQRADYVKGWDEASAKIATLILP